ncbi:uncharacterized protein PSANT_05027 [Moesziomyces antarcticus]|uniref:Zn(2)-C6 fungal-type domain-containing protein n=2 Tax=Pseudozyma antarctica TaxID=84753 RepID=A0A5C3FVH7_PSEA2|nr:uncharacterized protein PSANT_05027 [Moesziomyces antarcticus]
MNTPPKFSHSRQGSVDLPSSSSAAHLHHPSLSGHAPSGSHTPGHHSPLTTYGHALASLAYPASSYSHSPYRSAQNLPVGSWAANNPSALHSSAPPSSSKRSQSRDADEDDEEDDDEDDDDDDDGDSDDSDDSDDDDEDDDDGDQTNDGKPKGANNKRKRDASPKNASAKKKATAKDKQGDKSGGANGTKDGATGQKKQKPTRGARACTNCRRLKMRCVGAEKGPPCNRCRNGNHECIFEESNRGKKGGKNQKAEAMQQSLRKMEQTLATVLRSIRDPGLAAQHGGMVTRSPSPTFPREPERAPKEPQRSDPRLTHSHSFSSAADYGPRSPWTRGPDPYSQHGTHASGSPARVSNDGTSPVGTINPSAVAQRSASSTDGSTHSPANAHGTRFLEPLPHHHRQQSRPGPPGSEPPRNRPSRGSPRLHSLPDNTLNPLGLLAEASLHNTHRARKQAASRSVASTSSREKDSQRSGSTGGQSPDKTIKSEGGDDTTPEGDANAANEDAQRKIPLGVASQNYFRPGPMTILPLRRIIIEREMPPELLTLGIVSSEEVLDLFSIFFRRCTQHLCLLDAEWHTPTFICSRSPFLFTCVCTVAAKFYDPRPDLHAKCMALTRKVAFDVVNRGFKSIEIVQGFLLMAMYAQPAERFEEDKTWMYSGIALRMATDLNLHRKSVATFNHSPHPDDPAVLDREREILNRERTWYVCFAVDRGVSIQMGKPYTIREDWIIRNCRNWGSRFSRPWDLSVSAVVDLYRISSRQLDFLYSSTSSVSGLNTEIDYSLVLPVFNEQLQEWREEWRWRGLFSIPEEGEEYIEKKRRKKAAAAEKEAAAAAKDGDKDKDTNGAANKSTAADYEYDDDDEDAENLDLNTRILIHHAHSVPVRYSFAVLVLNSFGLQQAVDHPTGANLDRAQYFAKCLEAAKTIVTNCCGPSRRNMRYAPDAHILTLAYACVFLLKLLRPAFAGYVEEESILTLVQGAVDMLEEVAVNETHTPYLYSAFLRALVQARRDHTSASKSAQGSRVVSRAVSPEAMDQDAPDAAATGAANLPEGVPASGVAEGTIPAALDPSHADFTGNAEGNVNWPSQIFGATSGMDDFWGSLLPPGFSQTSMHDLFGAASVDGPGANGHAHLAAEAEVVEPSQHATKFGMGGGGAFDFGGGAIGNGNGGVPMNSAAASAALANSMSMTPVASGHFSGANTPHGLGSRSRRTSASHFNLGGLSSVNFDFSS